MPPSCALLGGFAIGARVALLWQHNANRSYKLAFVSDIAVFVLKSDDKLQPTNQPTSLPPPNDIIIIIIFNDNVYGAVLMTMVTARVHPVHLMNAD